MVPVQGAVTDVESVGAAKAGHAVKMPVPPPDRLVMSMWARYVVPMLVKDQWLVEAVVLYVYATKSVVAEPGKPLMGLGSMGLLAL